MDPKKCLCGADAEVRQMTRDTADGKTETLYWVSCPVCGQIGPKISDAGMEPANAIAEAIKAWNQMLARARPLEA